MKTIDYPKVTRLDSGKVYVSFKIQGKRVRVFNGNKFDLDINPNKYDFNQRIEVGNLLAAKIYEKLLIGDDLIKKADSKVLTDVEALNKALNSKLEEDHSKHHKTALNYTYRSLSRNIKGQTITEAAISKTLFHFTNPTSYNTMRRYLLVLFSEA